jgi:oligoribonuclease NrnB/cAMP/cGMP phosphodiesterase (DHH superfamily)
MKDKIIIFTDVCPSIESLIELSSIAKHITVIDHHETNLRKSEDSRLKSIPNIKMIFDMKRSACMMTWDYFFEGEKRPWFIEHVGDRDIWAQKLKYNNEIIKAIEFFEFINAKHLDKLDKLYDYDKEMLKKLIKFGKKIILITNKILNDESKYTREATIDVNKKTYRIWVGTIKSDLVSDFGNLLTTKKFNDDTYPDFILIWNYIPTSDSWAISLRGNDNSPNLSKIAEEFGGGGHPKASGFKLTNGKKLQSILVFI